MSTSYEEYGTAVADLNAAWGRLKRDGSPLFSNQEFLDELRKASTAVRDFRETTAYSFASQVMLPNILDLHRLADRSAPRLTYLYKVGAICQCSRCFEIGSELAMWLKKLQAKNTQNLPKEFRGYLPARFSKTTPVMEKFSMDELIFNYGDKLPIRDRDLEENQIIRAKYAPAIPKEHLDNSGPRYVIAYTVHLIRIDHYQDLLVEWRVKNNIGELEKIIDWFFGGKGKPNDSIGARYVDNNRAELLVRTLNRADPNPKAWTGNVSVHRMSIEYVKKQLSSLKPPLDNFAVPLSQYIEVEKEPMDLLKPRVTIVEVRRFPFRIEPVNLQFYTPLDEKRSEEPKTQNDYDAYKTNNFWSRLKRWRPQEWDWFVWLAESLPASGADKAMARRMHNMAQIYNSL